MINMYPPTRLRKMLYLVTGLVLMGLLIGPGPWRNELHGQDQAATGSNLDESRSGDDDPASETGPLEPAGEVPSGGDDPAVDSPGQDKQQEAADSSTVLEEDEDASAGSAPQGRGRLAALTIFVLAIFVGFEVITKVPPTLHTPLMSGSNAISGIAVVGAIVVAGQVGLISSWLGMMAITLATVNVVGGFLVTHRMLAMFRKR